MDSLSIQTFTELSGAVQDDFNATKSLAEALFWQRFTVACMAMRRNRGLIYVSPTERGMIVQDVRTGDQYEYRYRRGQVSFDIDEIAYAARVVEKFMETSAELHPVKLSKFEKDVIAQLSKNLGV